MTTTILHVSDTHLGNRQYRSRQRCDDFANAFDQAVDIALGEHSDYDNDPVDAVIHTGDLFDDTSPSLDDVHECQRILARLADADIPFYAIVGNHERKMRTQFMDLYEDAGLATRLDQEPTMVGDEDEVALYGIDAVRDRSWDSADFSLTPPEADDAYSIVCMHQLFAPPISDEFIAEYDLEPVVNRFETDVDAMALGDYHKRCAATVNGVKAFYPGSTERCAKSETDPRYVDILSVDPDRETTFQREQFQLNTRRFVVIPIEFGTGDTIDYVDQRLDEHEPLEDAVAIVELKGEQVPVTNKQIHERLQAREVTVSRVDDKRTLTEFNDADVPETAEVQDIDTAIDDALDEADLSDVTLGIEDVVRDDDDVAKSNVEAEVQDLFKDIQAEKFDDDEPTTEADQ